MEFTSHAARITALGLLLGSVAAQATDPAPISVGAFEVTPELEIQTRYDDNIFRSFTDEFDDIILEVKPSLSAVMESGANSLSFDLGLADATYDDSSPDEYTDWTVDADAHLEANSKNAFDLYAGYHFLHEARGQGFSQGQLFLLLDRPDTFEEIVYGAAYTYGGEDNKARLNIAADVYDKEYERFDNDQLTRNRTNTGLTGTFFYGVSDKTDIVASARYTEVDYDEAPLDVNPGLDSDETEFLLGVQWEATGKTTGKVLLGVVNKDFDDNLRQDWDNEFTWDAEVIYQANDFHVLTFGASNDQLEAVGTSDFINSDAYTASWDWEVNDLTRVNAFIRVSEDDFEGDVRADDTFLAQIGIERDLRRWFTLGASYIYDERDSNIFSLDYERNVFMVDLKFSL